MQIVRSTIWRDLLGVTALALFSLGLGIWARKPCHEKPAKIEGIPHPSLSLQEFQAHLDNPGAVVLDARNSAAYREGHIPGALSLPAAEFETAYEGLKPLLWPQREKIIVVYCSDVWCGQADMLQQKLINHGFLHVGRFPDGWAAWREAGLPVEKSP